MRSPWVQICSTMVPRSPCDTRSSSTEWEVRDMASEQSARVRDASLSESTVEDVALDWLASLGWAVAHGPDIAPDTPAAERADYGTVVLTNRLRSALARELLRSIDTSHVVGLRDRALLGTLAYTGARVGALARLRCGDLEDQGDQRVLRFREKGGQQREIPVRHDLDRWLEAYLQAARIAADPKETPLFRSAMGKQKKLSRNPLSANAMRRMLKRRLKDARLPDIFSPHSFRVLVVTDLLTQDVPLEDVQYLAGHANPKTTQIYDRRQKRVTRNIVERISV